MFYYVVCGVCAVCAVCYVALCDAWKRLADVANLVIYFLLRVSVSAMLVETRQKNIAQAFILERYFFVSICPAASHGTCLAVFLAAVLLLC